MPVFENLNLNVFKGKFIVIAGPNGAGKTTLLKTMNGLFKLTSGQILHDGNIITNIRHLTKHVGIVFQNPDEQIFFPNVKDDIAFGLRNQNIPEELIDKKVDTVINELKLSNFVNRSFFNLSFGEKKKVAFAGILVCKPDVMVLDEPTIGLDPWSKFHFINLILDLKDDSRAIVSVSHDYDLIKKADEIYLLWNKKLSGPFYSIEEYQKAAQVIKIY